MKWAKERDELIAQTKAFVQSVTGRKAETALEPNPLVPSRSELARAEYSGFTPRPVPAEPSVSFEPTEKPEQAHVPPLGAPSARVLPQSEVRIEIQNRVAAFQAHQHRFHREREAYFKSVLTKVRLAIENGRDAPSA
jgi:hypothetical protein